MKIFNKNIDIFWTPWSWTEMWPKTAYFEPEPVIKSVLHSRGNDLEYLKCPSFQNYYHNTFLIRCPVDLTIFIQTNPDGSKSIGLKEFDQQFFDTHIHPRFNQNSTNSMLSIDFLYLFYSEESVILEQSSAAMESTAFVKNTVQVPGEYDISKWIRAMGCAFEIIDDTKPIELKRGDPLYYVKFRTDKKVNLVRVDQSDTLEKLESSCSKLKKYVEKNSLEENYKSAESLINFHKMELFKKKSCPFKFWNKYKGK